MASKRQGKDAGLPHALRPILGLVLTGYGLLILLGLVAHEARWLGWVSLVLGALLLAMAWRARRTSSPPSPSSSSPTSPSLSIRPAAPRPRSSITAAVAGIALAATVLAYNVAAGSSLGTPERGLVAYGLALAAVAPFLGRRIAGVPVATAVAWSLAVVLAPLALFALNAVITSAGATSTAATPAVVALVVVPTAWCLRALGTDVALRGDHLVLPTAEGTLSLGVGLVCAGLYPMVLFLGMLGMHVWTERVPRARALRLAAGGLAALWAVNVVRLLIVVEVGRREGAAALQTVHAHAGWVLFGLGMLAFWAVVLRGRTASTPPAAGPTP